MIVIKIAFCVSMFLAVVGGNVEVIRWVNERSLTLGQGIGLAGLIGIGNIMALAICAIVVREEDE